MQSVETSLLLAHKQAWCLVRACVAAAGMRSTPETARSSSVVATTCFTQVSLLASPNRPCSLLPLPGTRDVLETAGLAGHQIEVLQSQGWDAYQKLVGPASRVKAVRLVNRYHHGSIAQSLQSVLIFPPPPCTPAKFRPHFTVPSLPAAAPGGACQGSPAQPAAAGRQPRCCGA